MTALAYTAAVVLPAGLVLLAWASWPRRVQGRHEPGSRRAPYGADETFAHQLATITEELAAVPASADPAIEPAWWQARPGEEELAPLYHRSGPPAPPAGLSHTDAWSRDGLLARIRGTQPEE